MNILNENELKQIDKMKSSISSPAEFQTLTNEDAVNIAEWTACLLNALDAFGSEHFVVACIGMLKSGVHPHQSAGAKQRRLAHGVRF